MAGTTVKPSSTPSRAVSVWAAAVPESLETYPKAARSSAKNPGPSASPNVSPAVHRPVNTPPRRPPPGRLGSACDAVGQHGKAEHLLTGVAAADYAGEYVDTHGGQDRGQGDECRRAGEDEEAQDVRPQLAEPFSDPRPERHHE